MRFGLQIGALDWPALRRVAETAEGLGFHTLYFPDHLVHEGPERNRMELPAYDPMVQAAVVAEATRRVRIGHLVLCNLFRHPAVTARSLATLDAQSDGRVVAGLGTGWTETEFRMTGLPYPDIATRLRMLDEALVCLKGVWGETPFTFEGEFYRFREATLLPRPVQRPHPPILLGGSGRGLLRLAAKHADVVNIISDVGRRGYISFAGVGQLGDDPFRQRVRFVREEAARCGRDPKSVAISNVTFTTVVADTPAQAAESAGGFAAMLGTSSEAIRRSPLFLIGTPEECVAEIRRRAREWEIEELVIAFVGEDTLRRFGTEVLPRV
jgi:probable F420-dependent oxidoreductase